MHRSRSTVASVSRFRTARSGARRAESTTSTGGPAGPTSRWTASPARLWNPAWSGRGDLNGRVVLGFHVASRGAVDGTYADLTGAGYKGLEAPHDAFWGARYAIVEDPDGIAVGLMSPKSAEFRSPP